ncbi:Pantothenate synthetase [termite gut metagenome]|uniref:pantoate--beta-alanine ligase (AMP-forming) n=1 Tax=termite gut metagenome TaxID=433724 RepID=A0A5J4SI54_9ZZZZ
MKIIHLITDLQTTLSSLKIQNKKIGFVPTMGALHEGHISLVRRSTEENDITVVSIFVNPTQFNDTNDLLKYPRTLEADCKLLEVAGVSVVFAPSIEEMYPQPDTRKFSYPPLDTFMEGAFRPGHFNGVCQIVSKLFDAVQPHRAYFGEKDFQQLAIIREMVRHLKYNIEIIGCPIVREESGLAMSSRNTRLSPSERKIAPGIYWTLSESHIYASNHSISQTYKFVENIIAAIPSMRLEYFKIINGENLQDVKDWNKASHIVGCIAVHCGEGRLIDNITYKNVNL